MRFQWRYRENMPSITIYWRRGKLLYRRQYDDGGGVQSSSPEEFVDGVVFAIIMIVLRRTRTGGVAARSPDRKTCVYCELNKRSASLQS